MLFFSCESSVSGGGVPRLRDMLRPRHDAPVMTFLWVFYVGAGSTASPAWKAVL
jgi:hypothetical protein